MREKNEKQLQIIDEFYKEFLSYRPESIGVWFGAGALVLIYGIYMWVPWAYHTEPIVDALMLFFGFFAPYLYLTPYRVYNDPAAGGGTPGAKSIAEKLRYLPVDMTCLRYYRLKKLARFCGWTGCIYAAGQLVLSFAITKELTWQTIAFAFLAGIVWPLGSNSEIIRMIMEKKQ